MPCERKHIEAIEQIVDRDEQFIDAATTVALRAAISAALAAADKSPWRSMGTYSEGLMALFMDFNETDVSKVCWVDWIAGGKGMMFPKRKPSHWMPLPAAPEGKP